MKSRLNFSPKPFKTRDTALVGLWIANIAAIAVLAVTGLIWLDLRGRNASAHARIADLKQDQAEIAERHRGIVAQLRELGHRVEEVG